MDITCPDYKAIEATSDYGSREKSGAEADPITGFCLTKFGKTGIIGCLHRVEMIHNLSFVQMGSILCWRIYCQAQPSSIQLQLQLVGLR